MSTEELPEDDDAKLTPWDRRVIAAIDVAQGARTGVRALRVCAAAIVLLSAGGQAVFYFSPGGDGPSPEIDRQLVGAYLASIATTIAFAALVFALSYIVQIAAARLDIDIVLSDVDEVDTKS